MRRNGLGVHLWISTGPREAVGLGVSVVVGLLTNHTRALRFLAAGAFVAMIWVGWQRSTPSCCPTPSPCAPVLPLSAFCPLFNGNPASV
jgi:hypothetical protein